MDITVSPLLAVMFALSRRDDIPIFEALDSLSPHAHVENGIEVFNDPDTLPDWLVALIRETTEGISR